MQKEAAGKLFSLREQVSLCEDESIQKDWNYLQACDHFYYMSTKHFNDGAVHRFFNPYPSPYEAFINFMNVLSDFKLRLNSFVKDDSVSLEIASLKKIITEKETALNKKKTELTKLRKELKDKKRQKG